MKKPKPVNTNWNVRPGKPVEIWTLAGNGDDETIEEIIDIVRYSLGVAEEAEFARPETISALRAWCNAEHKRLHPPAPRPSPEGEIRASLQRSPWWSFWESLQAGQEVRWTETKNATYFVVHPEPVTQLPDGNYGRTGYYIELRRHSGKTFWTHIAKVRPLD